MRVHGVDEGVVLLLRGLQHHGPAVQEVVVLGRPAVDDGRRFARLLVRGGEGAILGDPAGEEREGGEGEREMVSPKIVFLVGGMNI